MTRKWYDDHGLLRELYITQKLSKVEISARLGVTEETVRLLLIKHGLEKGKR
jgi:DNA-binding transcriptional regulator LsrR (DeoR family)